jgi:hypothetical protein
MEPNFTDCFCLGLSGMLCHILFSLDALIRQGKKVDLQKYLKAKQFSIALTLILVIQSAYFHKMYTDFIIKYWNIDGYSLLVFWFIGLFAQPIMQKIVGKGTDFIDRH